MALFSSSCLLLGLASLLILVQAQDAQNVRVYNFTAGWVTRNPDGMFDKPTMAINGQWPLPAINVTKGDRVIVNLYNDLKNESTSLHFHGLFQNGTTHMDGPESVSQCNVPPGSSFTYNFTVDQPGTYWYHSHVRGQYPDGLRGPLLVNDPDSPYADVIDEQVVMTLSDHYHDPMPSLLKGFISVANPTGAEPVPQSALINDAQNVSFAVQPGKTYFFRIINIAAFAAQYIWFEGHTMEIIEVDGVWTERQKADMIYVTAAQRYGVLITAKNSTDANFAIVGSMDQDLFDTVPPGLNPNVTAWLVYDDTKAKPAPALIDAFEPYDDFGLVPTDGEELWQNPSQSITLNLMMDNLGDGANYAFMNGITWVAPKVPTLYTVLTTGQAANSSEVYGYNTNSFVLGHNQVIEIVLNNNDPGKHPFHLHGHTFQAIIRSDDDAGFYDPTNTTENSNLPRVPMRRDTLLIRPNGHFVIRFRSDNPGVWLFHCHIEWHVASGLTMTVIEAPLALQQKLPYSDIPADHLAVCKAQGQPTAGNAAGNTKDYFDLTGENRSVPPLPAGFTARGIVALVFSCISAFLGMAVVGWYGLKPLSEKERVHMEKNVEKMEKI